jgi:hypothetical protein
MRNFPDLTCEISEKSEVNNARLSSIRATAKGRLTDDRVASALSEGMPLSEIANNLGLSASGTEKSFARIRKALGAQAA